MEHTSDNLGIPASVTTALEQLDRSLLKELQSPQVGNPFQARGTVVWEVLREIRREVGSAWDDSSIGAAVRAGAFWLCAAVEADLLPELSRIEPGQGVDPGLVKRLQVRAGISAEAAEAALTVWHAVLYPSGICRVTWLVDVSPRMLARGVLATVHGRLLQRIPWLREKYPGQWQFSHRQLVFKECCDKPMEEAEVAGGPAESSPVRHGYACDCPGRSPATVAAENELVSPNRTVCRGELEFTLVPADGDGVALAVECPCPTPCEFQSVPYRRGRCNTCGGVLYDALEGKNMVHVYYRGVKPGRYRYGVTVRGAPPKSVLSPYHLAVRFRGRDLSIKEVGAEPGEQAFVVELREEHFTGTNWPQGRLVEALERSADSSLQPQRPGQRTADFVVAITDLAPTREGLARLRTLIQDERRQCLFLWFGRDSPQWGNLKVGGPPSKRVVDVPAPPDASVVEACVDEVFRRIVSSLPQL